MTGQRFGHVLELKGDFLVFAAVRNQLYRSFAADNLNTAQFGQLMICESGKPVFFWRMVEDSLKIKVVKHPGLIHITKIKLNLHDFTRFQNPARQQSSTLLLHRQISSRLSKVDKHWPIFNPNNEKKTTPTPKALNQ